MLNDNVVVEDVRPSLSHASIEHVLVAFDGSEQSSKALDHALSQYEGANISVLHVVEPKSSVYGDRKGGFPFRTTYEQEIEQGEDLCSDARDRAEAVGVLATTGLEIAVEVGRPARTIVSYAAEYDVDHIIMGSHGRTGISRVLFGSVAETVTRRASVPVTIVR